MPDHAMIRAALERVVDPCSIATGVPINLVDMGMVRTITHDDGEVRVALRLTSPICWQAANIVARVEEVLAPLAGVDTVVCTLDPASDWMPDMMASHAREKLRRLRPVTKMRL